MFKLTLNIFIMFIFALSSFSGVKVEAHSDHEQHVSHEISSEHHEESDCDNVTQFSCGDDDCSSADGCCVGNCGCPASFILKFSTNNLALLNTSFKDINWFYFSNYTSPILSPALRPPLHS